MRIGLSLPWFLRAGTAEIGGGYLMWLWLREGRSVCYGGVFTLLSLIWAGAWTAPRPDRWDVVGVALALPSAGLMMYALRA